MAPDQSSSCWLVAGRPHSSFAAHKVVAAFPLPPPMPAPALSRPTVTCATCTSKQRWTSTAKLAIFKLCKDSFASPVVAGRHHVRARSMCWESVHKGWGRTSRNDLAKVDVEMLRCACVLAEQIQCLHNARYSRDAAAVHGLTIQSHCSTSQRRCLKVGSLHTRMTRLVPSTGMSGTLHSS